MKKKWKFSKWKIVGLVLIVFVFLWMNVVAYNYYKSLPEGVNWVGEEYFVGEDDIEFLFDLTYLDEGVTKYDQHIYDRIYDVIDGAENFILIDMFLFNVVDEENGEVAKLVDKLIEKKKENPDMKIDFITDDINTYYGSNEPYWINELEEAGVNIIFSDLSEMRDTKLFYTGFWRVFVQWFGTKGEGWIDYGGDRKITIRSFLKFYNKNTILSLSTNHRAKHI